MILKQKDDRSKAKGVHLRAICSACAWRLRNLTLSSIGKQIKREDLDETRINLKVFQLNGPVGK
jgi:hypothetical protein